MKLGLSSDLSFLWPEEDLPYCERTGVRPDILINPHAFPSRMTIGMLVESMASKAGALSGRFVDASPFQHARDGDKFVPPIEEHGETLRKHGYDYCGSETMINGTTGEAFDVDISRKQAFVQVSLERRTGKLAVNIDFQLVKVYQHDSYKASNRVIMSLIHE